MAIIVVLEDAWDGHYELSTACHQAGHRVFAVQHPSLLPATLRNAPADLLLVDTGIPGVSLGGIETMATDAGVPVVATGYAPWSALRGLAAFVPKPSPASAIVDAVEVALAARRRAAA